MAKAKKPTKPIKKAAPVKKVVAAKAVKKAVPAKKAAPAKKALPAKKAVKKPAPKAVAKPIAKAKVVAKPAPKAATKPTPKVVTKPAPKTIVPSVEKAASPKVKSQVPKGQIRHIAIAGNIGAGKSTLTALLSKHFGWTAQYEDVENNPYLNDFYEDMPRWSFNLQVFFLNSRFRQIIEIQKGTEVVVQDRTIHEDAQIFAPNLHAMGLMSTRDFENYTRLFETITSLIHPPDLLIYLKASVPTLVNQIQKRGREYEDNLRLDYLKRLNEFYEKWTASYKGRILVIDIDQNNFVDEEDALANVINKVNAELFGLF
jgi:deoxyadenosine/deoxycytidine kinase